MEREQVIRMAREAGFKASIGKTDQEGKYHPDINALSKYVPVEWLERFADLVAEAEREECAKVCDERAQMHEDAAPYEETSDYMLRMLVYAKHERRCGAAIRSRSQA